ncbi:uncharacterized protein UTRI_10200 [Ustilago trichophora]|uniref:Uncharacterized protein n=1 Tax=Ustilago trichophora TaxID=86804 RepID=A0A5C3EEZ3_9BASI|nr:uncharacterized protein UTRI_10200 [Ustilago trichophora]
MKIAFVQPCALLGLLAFLVLMPLISSVSAHEDPDEPFRRRHNDERWLRNRYLGEYRPGQSRPTEQLILQEYPSDITDAVRKLQSFGTRDWKTEGNVMSELHRMSRAVNPLLDSAFHPDMVEFQPLHIRQQHYEAFKQMTDWMTNHFDSMVSLESKLVAGYRLDHYKRIRNLAQISRFLPLHSMW